MGKTREQSIQMLLEKLACIFRTVASNTEFPFKQNQLNKTQAHILFFVARSKNDIAVKDLAKALKITSGAVTQYLNELVAKNLVKREEDQKDRRILKITLTESTKKHFETFKKVYFSAVCPLFADLADGEINQIAALLGKIRTDF